MWVFLNDAFVSIVQHKEHRDKLIVRARFAGDLELVFPDLAGRVKKTPNADYRFRVIVDRSRVMNALMEEVGRIDYPNFKDSVDDWKRAQVYMSVWSTMFNAQQDAAGERTAWAFEPKV